MTVEEVKTILQTAGVNLNDTQYAAIQSLLGSGGDDNILELVISSALNDLNSRIIVLDAKVQVLSEIVSQLENN